MSSIIPREIQYSKSHVDDHRNGQVYDTNVGCALAAYLAVLLRLIARSLTSKIWT